MLPGPIPIHRPGYAAPSPLLLEGKPACIPSGEQKHIWMRPPSRRNMAKLALIGKMLGLSWAERRMEELMPQNMSAVPPTTELYDHFPKLPKLVLINKFLGDLPFRLFRVYGFPAIIIAWQSPQGHSVQMSMLIFERTWIRHILPTSAHILQDRNMAKSPLSEAFNYRAAVGANPLVIGYFQFPFARPYILQFRICFKLCASGSPGESFNFFPFPFCAHFEHISLIRGDSGGRMRWLVSVKQDGKYMWAEGSLAGTLSPQPEPVRGVLVT